ncbi:MAG: PorP/SprF family type IX secretion system membrane protein [Bacteroidales bacterium]|nr:PorP/SprF family type IX secretion system membrane protein [Bacteroidales bacterium]
MLKGIKIIILILFLCKVLALYQGQAQDTDILSLYYNPVQVNPALTGAEGTGKLRLLYRDYYPGRGLNLHTISCSYDTFVEEAHGGLGIFLSENILGEILNDFRAGVAYSYHLRASRDFYVNAGFMAALVHRSMDAGKIVLPDQIDPLRGAVLPSGEQINSMSRTVFDAGIGFLFSYRNYHSGISVSHIFRPDLVGNGLEDSRAGRRITLHGGTELYPGPEGLSISPAFLFNIQDNMIISAAGAAVSYNNISINLLPFFEPGGGLSFIQSGLFFEAGRMELGYNYNFNPVQNSSLQPFTMSNQVYIAIGLNNVEKRDVIKAIIFPKL